jgi:hypothetical protein
MRRQSAVITKTSLVISFFHIHCDWIQCACTFFSASLSTVCVSSFQNIILKMFRVSVEKKGSQSKIESRKRLHVANQNKEDIELSLSLTV